MEDICSIVVVISSKHQLFCGFYFPPRLSLPPTSHVFNNCTVYKVQASHNHVFFLLNNNNPDLSDFFCCCCRYTRSDLRSTCPIGLKSTTTKVPPSVNTVALCCGGWPSRASNVRVRGETFVIYKIKALKPERNLYFVTSRIHSCC